MRYAGREREE
jgi:hypothetical protein